MNLFELHDRRRDDRYAIALPRGASANFQRCHEPDGQIAWEESRQPLILEWDPGDKWHRNPTRLGDFTLAGGSVAVKRYIAEELRVLFSGWEPGPVELLPGPPELAFDNDVLREMWVTAWVEPNMERSTFEVFQQCPTCGKTLLLLTGEQVERGDTLLKGGDGVAKQSVPRMPGQGLFVRESDLAGVSIFRTEQFGGPFVTEDFANYVRRRGFTNVDFREVGETF